MLTTQNVNKCCEYLFNLGLAPYDLKKTKEYFQSLTTIDEERSETLRRIVLPISLIMIIAIGALAIGIRSKSLSKTAAFTNNTIPRPTIVFIVFWVSFIVSFILGMPFLWAYFIVHRASSLKAKQVRLLSSINQNLDLICNVFKKAWEHKTQFLIKAAPELLDQIRKDCEKNSKPNQRNYVSQKNTSFKEASLLKTAIDDLSKDYDKKIIQNEGVVSEECQIQSDYHYQLLCCELQLLAVSYVPTNQNFENIPAQFQDKILKVSNYAYQLVSGCDRRIGTANFNYIRITPPTEPNGEYKFESHEFSENVEEKSQL